ncbi:MAG TPA: hypothetical protein VGB07_15805 [Blastocatellia bacterium]
MLGAIKKLFIRSPWVIFAMATCTWSFSRLLIYRARIGPSRPAPFDIPVLTLSPVATEYNIGFTLSIFTVAGIIASVVALSRKQEGWRYLGLMTLALNLAAWWWMTTLVGWAFNPPPGIDY